MAKCRAVGRLHRSAVSDIAQRVYRRILQAECREVLLFVREGEVCIACSGAQELYYRLYQDHETWIVAMYNKTTTVRDIIDDLYDRINSK